jgi:wyosine [tRNA(Phe)-imidazoG37] synthetase (radical SAM superfamily)
MLLPLQQGILYGPVKSRRYGLSLGVNLMPGGYKLCSLNCVYCQYGLTTACTTDLTPHEADLPCVADVVRALEEKLRSSAPFNLITFSGNGEPTLHPQFAEIVDETVRLRDTHRPQVRIALLSNSTGLNIEAVRKSLAKIDLPILKLDVGTEKNFLAINRPARRVRFEDIVQHLIDLQNIYLQSLFVDGVPSNSGRGDIIAWMALLRNIRPREAHIYSIDRSVPSSQLKLVPPARLEEIASTAYRQTGVKVRAFYPKRRAVRV